MGYAQIIRVHIQDNFEGNHIYCDICDTSLDLPDPDVIHATPAASPLVLSWSEDDKFKGIKSALLTIRMRSSSTLGLQTFLTGDDGRWYVKCYHTSDSTANYIFQGWLIMEDIEQAFMPNPREIVLQATDNLGVLKDVPLTTKGGQYITTHTTISTYLAYALSKTGIETNINVINNIMEENTPTEPLYDTAYLWGKTFEEDVRVHINCYDAIELILGEDSRLFQYNGEWWIVRLDEYSSNGMYRHIFDDDGNLVSSEAINTWNKDIGLLENIKLINEDAV
ncbi:MAG TPA: hypothetical protein VGD26_10765, partial [Chitinophagaceae bacterium]